MLVFDFRHNFFSWTWRTNKRIYDQRQTLRAITQFNAFERTKRNRNRWNCTCNRFCHLQFLRSDQRRIAEKEESKNCARKWMKWERNSIENGVNYANTPLKSQLNDWHSFLFSHSIFSLCVQCLSVRLFLSNFLLFLLSFLGIAIVSRQWIIAIDDFILLTSRIVSVALLSLLTTWKCFVRWSSLFVEFSIFIFHCSELDDRRRWRRKEE